MLEPLARLGYACKAFIYAIVGLLACMAALERGGRVTDTKGALAVILSQPFGNTVLFVLAAGLCGYALWRLIDAIVDPDRHGTDFRGLTERIGNVVKAAVYGALGVEAFRLGRGLRASTGTDARVQMWTARLLDVPLGEWIVAGAGLIIAAYGISEIVEAVRHRDDTRMDLSSIPRDRRSVLLRICRFGVAARAVIIVAAGLFLVRAAIQDDPGEAHGIRESVLQLAAGAYGRWVLAGIALGLLAYAIDQALHARYRQIRSPL
jgi:hypothetical protein